MVNECLRLLGLAIHCLCSSVFMTTCSLASMIPQVVNLTVAGFRTRLTQQWSSSWLSRRSSNRSPVRIINLEWLPQMLLLPPPPSQPPPPRPPPPPPPPPLPLLQEACMSRSLNREMLWGNLRLKKHPRYAAIHWSLLTFVHSLFGSSVVVLSLLVSVANQSKPGSH